MEKLGGPGSSIASEKLTKNPLKTIWDDRVLNRAYDVFGGRPQVVLKAAGVGLPVELHRRLQEMITPAT